MKKHSKYFTGESFNKDQKPVIRQESMKIMQDASEYYALRNSPSKGKISFKKHKYDH